MSGRAMNSVGRLFVGNLPWTIGRKELKDYFSQYGQVVMAQVLFNKDTGLSRGYGFIKFINENAHDAVLAKDKHILEGNVLTVQQANNGVEKNFS